MEVCALLLGLLITATVLQDLLEPHARQLPLVLPVHVRMEEPAMCLGQVISAVADLVLQGPTVKQSLPPVLLTLA